MNDESSVVYTLKSVQVPKRKKKYESTFDHIKPVYTLNCVFSNIFKAIDHARIYCNDYKINICVYKCVNGNETPLSLIQPQTKNNFF